MSMRRETRQSTATTRRDCTMTLPFKLVSADSHIAEPPDLWTTRIDQRVP